MCAGVRSQQSTGSIRKKRRVTRETSTVTNSVDGSYDGDDGDYNASASTQRKSKGGNRKARTSTTVKLKIPPVKRRADEGNSPEDRFSFSPLFDAIGGALDVDGTGTGEGGLIPAGVPFENVLEEQLPELRQARKRYLESTAERNQWNHVLRPLTGHDNFTFKVSLESDPTSEPSRFDALLERKLKLANQKLRQGQTTPLRLQAAVKEGGLTKPERNPKPPAPDPIIINALESIGTTPFDSSFASRLLGASKSSQSEYVFRDWEANSQWLDLMDDIHAFSALAHPDRETIERRIHPIDYQRLQPGHLPQLHDLLSRTFWPGINVEDALQFSPEKCTIVATYKHLVVGAALLSSPNETYITYLVVRSGWEGSQVATKMLYLLLQQSPHQDVILHVSANNPAMLLYNRFGFKAEEFIVGFYEEYMDRESRASKNAFRLRLRR